MALEGMDVAQVTSLANLMKQKAAEIQGIISTLSGQLSNTQWVGADRNQFEGDWHGTYTQQLTAVVNGLNDAGNRAMQNVNQQTQASAT